jgi:hypothetical protein
MARLRPFVPGWLRRRAMPRVMTETSHNYFFQHRIENPDGYRDGLAGFYATRSK